MTGLHLPPRQVEVCCLVAARESDQSIALTLQISVETVRFHLASAARNLRRFDPDRFVGTTPREVVFGWYRECRKVAFSRPRIAAH